MSRKKIPAAGLCGRAAGGNSVGWVYQMMPWPIMALATFMKPAMFAPFM